MNLSCYIPCFNNRGTLAEVIASVSQQTLAVQEIVVVDDASTDGSSEVAQAAGARVVMQLNNGGRGPARRRGMDETSAPFVVCCDATNVLPRDFTSQAMAWMKHPEVAAAYGRISQRPGGNAVIRWRGRHLFKIEVLQNPAVEVSTFATYGAIVRRSAVEAVGNYDSSLRHTEDAELGTRMLKSGWKIIYDPELVVYSVARNSLVQVLERYWRWHAGKDEYVSWRGYLKQVVYSIKVMAKQDWQACDPLCIPISLICPHYQFWKSFWRKKSRSSS